MNKKIKMIMILGILCLIVRNGAAQTCSVNAGVPASVCVSADSFVLSGNASGALATAPAWRFVSGPNTPVITDSTSSSTSVKGFIAGTYVFRYGAMCSDASEVADSVRITIEALPVFTAGADTFVCGSVIRMRATLPPGSSGTWAAPSSVIISSPASPSSTFSATGTPGSCPYSFDAVWTVTQGGCTATDTVNIGYGGERTELFTPIADETICGTAYTSPATYYYGCGGTMNVTQLSGPVTTSQTYLPEPSTSYYSRFEINGMVVGTYIYTVEVTRCSGALFRDTFQLTVGSTEPVTNSVYSSKSVCVQEYDTVYYFEPNRTLLPGETVTFELIPFSKPGGSPDPVADTTGNILRLRNVVHPDTGSVFDGFLYWYRYTVSNGTCTYSGVFVLQLNSPVPERGYESVLNLPCNTTTANIAVLKPGPLLYSTYRNLKVLSKPAGAPDPTLPPPFSSSIVVSGLQPGKYIFSFEYYRRSPDCGVKTHTVEVNVSQTPGLSNAGTDQVLPCGVDSSVLAGNTPPPGQQGTWRLVSGPSTVILTNPNAPSLLIKSLAPGLYRFRWEIAYGINCPANADEMQVIVTPNAPVTSAGPDQTVCYGYAIPLSGTGFGAGTTARWRQIGGSPLAIADSTASATTVSGTIASSVYTFSYTLSNVCGSSSDTVVVSTTASPGPSEARISTADTCIATSSLMLNAVAPASGSGIWRQLSGPAIATIAAPASNNTSVSGLTGGVYQFIWTVRQAGCDSLSDTVSVAYATGTIMANAGDDRFVCQDTLRLGAVPSSSGLGTWSQLSGSVATIADPADPATLVAGLQAGAYTFRWVVSLGVCPADTDEVNVVVSAAPSTAKAMNDTVICGLAMPSGTQITVPIRADTPSSGIGTWTILETPYGFGSTSGISDPAASNTTIKLVGGYYKLLWKVANGACPESVDTLSIDVVPMADAGSAPVRICEKKTYKLQGSLPGSGTVRWSQLDGPAVLSFTNPESEFTTVTNFDTGTYLIRYEVLHPGVGCSSADTITIINDKSVSANAGRDTVFCWKPGGTTLYLQADTPSAGTGTWFRNNGMGSVSYSPGTNSNPTNATVSDAGLHQFRWTVRNGACQTIDYKNVIAERVTVPPIDFTPLTVCKDSFTVQVSSPYTDFEYAWSFQRARITDTSGLNLSGPITNNFRISDTNKIYLTLTNPASGCSATDSTEIIVNCSYLPLPLTLLSFNAYKRGATVLVKWETAAEKNIRSYTVERSADGRLWQKLEELGATGNSSLRQEYRITDARPLAGINLYRLKIEEYDRSMSYSSSRQVNMDGAQTGILVFPNPADQAITVVWDNGDTVNYLLTDALGRKVLAGRLNINTSGRINLSALPQGSYVLKITSGAATISVHKVQIVR